MHFCFNRPTQSNQQLKSPLETTERISACSSIHPQRRLLFCLNHQPICLLYHSAPKTNPVSFASVVEIGDAALMGKQKLIIRRARSLNRTVVTATQMTLKLARRYAADVHGAEKSEIIAFKQGFHGRTFFTVTLSPPRTGCGRATRCR